MKNITLNLEETLNLGRLSSPYKMLYTMSDNYDKFHVVPSTLESIICEI